MSTDTQIKERTTVSLQPPKMWKVVFHNDDSTPMDLVIAILMKIFKHDQRRATDLTMEVHNEGSAIAGIYSYELAEQRAIEGTSMARDNGAPLKITAEEDE